MLRPPGSSIYRDSLLNKAVGALTDFRTLLPILQAAYEMGDIAIDLLGEGASVGFDPVFHLFLAAPLPELAGESNGEFLERVLHDVCLTEIRY